LSNSSNLKFEDFYNLYKQKMETVEIAQFLNSNIQSAQEGSMAKKIAKELAFVMYKPDAFERGLVGELMKLVDSKGLDLVYAKTLKITPSQVEQHYSHHLGKGFWPVLVNYITSGTTLACVYQGEQANSAIRQLIGSKHPTDSPPGSIRGKYATAFPKNLIHGSDDYMAAISEMGIFLSPSELNQMHKIAGIA
jgi:nucleoside-diphosphate kinase